MLRFLRDVSKSGDDVLLAASRCVGVGDGSDGGAQGRCGRGVMEAFIAPVRRGRCARAAFGRLGLA